MPYLDYNATHPIYPQVIDIMCETMKFPGNASATHKEGRKAFGFMESARYHLQKLIHAKKYDQIIFTSGGSEANALALNGHQKLLYSAIEHPAVLRHDQKCTSLNCQLIPVTSEGIICLDRYESLLKTQKPDIVSIMFANNETGIIQPIKKAVSLAHNYGALFHCDAIQALGRVPINVLDLNIDFMSFSSHKIGGPQGIGALYCKNPSEIVPLYHGGGQEQGRRPGTYNLAGIVGFGKACEIIQNNFGKTHVRELRDFLEKNLDPQLFMPVGMTQKRLYNTSLIITQTPCPSERQVIALDLKGFSVSSGSACAAGKEKKESYVLTAMGFKEDQCQRAIRISLGPQNTQQDIDALIQEWTSFLKNIS